MNDERTYVDEHRRCLQNEQYHHCKGVADSMMWLIPKYRPFQVPPAFVVLKDGIELSNEKLNDSLKILCSESFTSVSAPIQYAAIEAYTGDHTIYLNTVKKILSFTGNYAYENLKSNVINVTKPEGGFYLFPEFTNAKFSSSSAMCKDIINKTGVALLPGSDFGVDSNKMIARLSFTDFNGSEFLNNTLGSKKLDNADLKKYAPNIVDGVSALKEWSNSL